MGVVLVLFHLVKQLRDRHGVPGLKIGPLVPVCIKHPNNSATILGLFDLRHGDARQRLGEGRLGGRRGAADFDADLRLALRGCVGVFPDLSTISARATRGGPFAFRA